MSNFNLKQFVKQLLLNQGYDISVHRCSQEPYNGPKLAYIHIAKCGGISIDTALRNAFAKPKQRRIDRQSTLVTSLSSFTQNIENLESACDFSEHHAATLQNILHYHLGLNWQYVSGHVAANHQILSTYKSDYAFVTMLRNPVERFISNYIYNKLTNIMAIMPPNSISNIETADSLITEAKQILNSRRGWHMANAPTMCITGKFPNNAEQAKELTSEFAANLSQFKVVGFLSQLEKFTTDIEKLTARKINIPHKNAVKNINNPAQQEIKSTLSSFFNETSTQKKLHQLCQYEIVNYEAALNKL